MQRDILNCLKNNNQAAHGDYTYLFDFRNEIMLELKWKLLDWRDDILFLWTLNGGSQDEQQQLVHLLKSLWRHRLPTDFDRIGKFHN